MCSISLIGPANTLSCIAYTFQSTLYIARGAFGCYSCTYSAVQVWEISYSSCTQFPSSVILYSMCWINGFKIKICLLIFFSLSHWQKWNGWLPGLGWLLRILTRDTPVFMWKTWYFINLIHSQIYIYILIQIWLRNIYCVY